MCNNAGAIVIVSDANVQIHTLRAMLKGIFVSISVAHSNQDIETISNLAHIDRQKAVFL